MYTNSSAAHFCPMLYLHEYTLYRSQTIHIFTQPQHQMLRDKWLSASFLHCKHQNCTFLSLSFPPPPPPHPPCPVQTHSDGDAVASSRKKRTATMWSSIPSNNLYAHNFMLNKWREIKAAVHWLLMLSCRPRMASPHLSWASSVSPL